MAPIWRVSLAVITFLFAAAPRADAADDAPPLAAPQQLIVQNLQQLRDILENPNSSDAQREDAARRLVSRQSDQSRNVLLDVLTNSRNNAEPQRLAVLHALGDAQSVDQRTVAPLVQFLNDRALADAAVGALSRYAELGVVEARQAILRLAQDDKQPLALREAAIRGLGKVVDRDVAAVLIALLREPRPAIHNAADDALVDLTGLTANARDDAKWQQWNDAHARLGDGQWLADVLRTHGQHKAEQAQQALSSVTAHGKFLDKLYADAQKQKNEPAITSLILSSLDDPDPSLKIWGIKTVLNRFSLNERYPAEAPARIAQLVGDENPEVRIAAAGTLDRLNPDGTLKALITQTVQESNPQVKIALISSLGRLRDPRAIPVLRQLLEENDVPVVAAAADALQAIAANTPLARQVCDDLWTTQQKVEAANPPNAARLRAAYIEAMGRLSDQRHADDYAKLLDQNNPPEVRSAAFHAMGELHDPRRARVMDNALHNELSPEVRIEALEGLGGIGNFEEVAPYVFPEITEDRSPQVRNKAWEIFQKLLLAAQNTEVLSRWVQKFPEPDRQIFVLEALNAKLQRDAQKEQNPDERAKLLLNLASERAHAGDIYMKLNQPKAAAAKYQQALDQFEPRDQPPNANMVTLTLVRKLITALLAAKDFQGAADFAHQETSRNPATIRDISTAIRDEADRLTSQGHQEEALRLINSAEEIKEPALVERDLEYLQDLKESIEKARRASRP